MYANNCWRRLSVVVSKHAQQQIAGLPQLHNMLLKWLYAGWHNLWRSGDRIVKKWRDQEMADSIYVICRKCRKSLNIILDQNRSRGTRTTTTGVSLVVCTIMHTESEIYNHAYWSCEILMVVCQKIWHGDAVLYYIACCPVCCVVLCIKPPVCCVVFQSIFDMTTPQLVVLYLLYCVLHCLLCCIVCITLCVKTCFTTLSFVVSAPVVSATICQNVAILPGKQWSQHIIVCTHNPPIYLQI